MTCCLGQEEPTTFFFFFFGCSDFLFVFLLGPHLPFDGNISKTEFPAECELEKGWEGGS